MDVHQSFSAKTEATPGDLYDVVSDLSTYPAWLDLVDVAEEQSEPDTWLVTLKARVGPFSRSKRLRMVRTVHLDDEATVRFERAEIDGKAHSAWVLAAGVSAIDDGPFRSEVLVALSYDGSMWSGLLDGVLGSAADRATRQLQDYVRS